MAGHDHGAARLCIVAQNRANDFSRHRINGLEGLIQDQQPGRVDQRAGKSDLLRHTCRVLHNERVAIVGQGKCIEQLGRAGGDLGRRHPAQQTDIAQQLRTTQPIEEPQSVRQDAHQGLRCSWVSPDIMIKNACRTGIRAQ